MPAPSPDVLKKLQALKDSFAQQLPEKVSNIHTLWQSLSMETWNWETVHTLHHLTHTLAGSGPTFGFQELGAKSRVAERLLKDWISNGSIPNTEEIAIMSEQIDRLNTSDPESSKPESIEPPGTKEAESIKPSGTKKPSAKNPLVRDESLIYILDENDLFSSTVVTSLQQFDYKVELFSEPGQLQDALSSSLPAALIAEIPGSGYNLKALLAQHRLKNIEGIGYLPVILISREDDLGTRLEAARNGGDAFITCPLDPAHVIDQLDHLIGKYHQEQYRILIVDDDEELATHHQLILQQAGMEVFTVTEPSNVLVALSDNLPDLIVMDIYMPDCTGIELAMVIRQQDAYLSIPIIYLSSEDDMEKQFAAMRIGGDDFITKPVDDRRLVSTISIRAERARTLNNLMIKDSLTGLFKHTKIKEQLAVEFSRAERSNEPLSFAMVDIDHFKSVNDTHGHITGDRVIKSLSRLLTQRLRKSDSIGRYGGEEFAVVLPSCNEQCAENVMNEIRETFSRLDFTHDGKAFNATISIGIASLHDHSSPEALNLAADVALYSAKENGRNRVMMHHGADPKTNK